jgi:hypothetical protein
MEHNQVPPASMIMSLRRQLLAALREFDEEGAPAVDAPSAYRVKHGSLRVADGGDWMEELRRCGGAGRSEIDAPSQAASTPG